MAATAVETIILSTTSSLCAAFIVYLAGRFGPALAGKVTQAFKKSLVSQKSA